MKKFELLATASLGALLVIAGLAWFFGPFVLIGVGVVLIAAAFLVPAKED